MSLNDRIALKLGSEVLARLLAEEQVAALQEQLATQRASLEREFELQAAAPKKGKQQDVEP